MAKNTLAVEISSTLIAELNEMLEDNKTLRADLQTAVAHIRDILAENGEATNALVAADLWLAKYDKGEG